VESLKINNQQVTLVDQVETRLLSFLKEKNMKIGDGLPSEQEMVISLGVARGVLREALSRLRMMGLIETRTRRGMVLSEPKILIGIEKVMDPRLLSDKTLFNLLGLRIAIEIGICRQLIDNLNNSYLEELEYIVNEGIVFDNNLYTPVSEYEFHAKLFEITGNSTLVEFQSIIRPVSVFLKSKFQDLIEPLNKENAKLGKIVTHKELFELLKKRDKDGFRNALEVHFLPYYTLLQKSTSPEIENH